MWRARRNTAITIYSTAGIHLGACFVSLMSRLCKSEMSVEAFYSLYAHYQLVSGFTNNKYEM